MHIRMGPNAGTAVSIIPTAPPLMSRLRTAVMLLVLTAAAMTLPHSAFAEPPKPAAVSGPATAPLPEWDRLSVEQRALLIAPMRQRWNDNPDRRSDLYQHAQRWQSMTPEQRSKARNGKKRFDRMDPQQRQQARALFDRMQSMPPEQRKALKEQWKAMTPEQRRAWVQQNAAGT